MRLPPPPEPMSTESTAADPRLRREAELSPQRGAQPEQIERFRALLSRDSMSEPPPLPAQERESPPQAGFEPLHYAQLQLRLQQAEAPPAAAAAPPPPSATLADLIERHVRQLAVAPVGLQREGLLLRLSEDSVLPGASLLLTRGASGWNLRIDARDAADVRHHVAELQQRFAASGLGSLAVDLRG